MKLEELDWVRETNWDSADVGDINVLHVTSPEAHASGKPIGVGMYHINLTGSVRGAEGRTHITRLDPLAAQAVLLDLLARYPGGKCDEVPVSL